MVKLGEDCEDDYQCQNMDSFSFCNSNSKKCECSKGFLEYQGICSSVLCKTLFMKNKILISILNIHTFFCIYFNNNINFHTASNVNCSSEQPCKQFNENALCDSNSCICQGEHVAYENKCFDNVVFDASCIDTVQCIKFLGSGGICKDGKCKCSEKYFNDPPLKETANADYNKIKCYPIVGMYKIQNSIQIYIAKYLE